MTQLCLWAVRESLLVSSGKVFFLDREESLCKEGSFPIHSFPSCLVYCNMKTWCPRLWQSACDHENQFTKNGKEEGKQKRGPGSLRTLLTFEPAWEPPVFRVSCEIKVFLVTSGILSFEADCLLTKSLVNHGELGK